MIKDRNAIFGHVARLPDDTAAQYAPSGAVSRSIDQLIRPGNVNAVVRALNGPISCVVTTTMRISGDKPSADVTGET